MHPDEARGLLANLLSQGAAFILSSLGYTPANRAGDTFTGTVNVDAALNRRHAQTTDAFINLATTGLSNTVMGFNDSGVTNGNGVPNQHSYYGNLNGYPIAWTSNGALLGTWSSSLLAPRTQVALQTAGTGLSIKEGANCKQGIATLVAGTVTVANTSVTANSRIQLTAQNLSGAAAPQALAVTARVAGVSFTITSASVADTSTVAYEIFEPS